MVWGFSRKPKNDIVARSVQPAAENSIRAPESKQVQPETLEPRRQVIIKFVQSSFPDRVAQATYKVGLVNDAATLQNILFKLAVVSSSAEVEQILNDIAV